MFKHKLGTKAKDKITGFKGILTARAEFLTGCNRYCIQPTKLKNGTPIEPIYFDEDCIEIIDDTVISVVVKEKKTGACSPDPAK